MAYSGTVLDDTGKALSMAIVDIPGCGRGITDDYGAFEFSIPDSRTKSLYDVITHLDGYATDHQALPGPHPQKYLNIALKHPILAAADTLIQTRGRRAFCLRQSCLVSSRRKVLTLARAAKSRRQESGPMYP